MDIVLHAAKMIYVWIHYFWIYGCVKLAFHVIVGLCLTGLHA